MSFLKIILNVKDAAKIMLNVTQLTLSRKV